MTKPLADARYPETRDLSPRQRLLAVLLVGLTIATLGVLRASDAAAQFPYGESFQNGTAPGFVLGGAASLTSGGSDTAGNGWLRLTPATNNRFGFAYNQTAFPSTEGISYEFDYAVHGGSGADGFAFVLFDGATTDAQFNAGPQGGALGYTNCPGVGPGLSNAYMALGFDVYGFFASRVICQNQTGLGNQMYPNYITVRGGAPNYNFLHAVQATGGVGTTDRTGARHVTVTVLPKNGQTTLSASMRLPNGTVQEIATDLVLPNPPPTLKFGFTASTGGSNNNHEIRGMRVAKPTDLQVAVDADEPFAARDAVQSYTATVTNAGPNPATGVDLSSEMPDTEGAEWTCTATGGASCAFPSGVGSIDGDFGPLPVGGELELKVTGTLADDADFSKLSFEAQPTGDTADVNPDDNRDEASTEVTPVLGAAPTYTLSAAGLATASSTGTARGGNLTRSWQWYRCAPVGDDCAVIDGASAATYQTIAADRESNLRVLETVGNDAGSVSAESAAWTLPDTTIVSGPPAVTNQVSAFEFSSVPGAGFECQLDSASSWSQCASLTTYSDLSDGDHTLEVRAVFGGLSDPTPETYSWTVDTTTSVTIDSPAAGPTNDASPTVELTGEPDASWTLRVDGGIVDSGTFDADGNATSTAVANLSDGTRVLRVDVEDEAGNTDHDEITLNVDTVAPLPPSIGHGPPAATSDTDAEIDFTVEPGTRAECRLDGGPWAPCISPWKGADLPDGKHVLEIRTTDDADNESDVTRYEWTVDTEDPAPVTWGDVPGTQSSDPNPTLTFTAEPGSRTLCRLDGGRWEPCSSPLILDRLGDGPHVLEVKVVDPAGNESPVVEHRWTVDTSPPPAPTVLSGPSGSTTDTTTTFSIAGEPGAALECSLDGGAWVPCPGTLALNGLGLGEHVLRLRQTDAAGNVSPVGEHRWTVVPVAIVPPAGNPTVARATVAAQSTVTASAGTVRVGCAIDAGALDRCVVRIYERRSDGKRGALLGTGSVRVKDGRSTTVDVRLNARGKRVVARTLGGRAVIIRSTATARGGKTLRAKDVRTRLYPQRLLTIPTVLPFAIDRGVVQGAARRVVADVAPQLHQAKSVRCIGFTDSKGSVAHNKRLGLRRAEAVCRTLRQMGIRAKLSSSSRGEEQPRATNATAAGREKNRRVELVARY